MTRSLHGGVGSNIQLSHAHAVRLPLNAFEHTADVERRQEALSEIWALLSQQTMGITDHYNQ